MLIPKIIHYCWFGGKEKPNIVKKCIESWKNNLPDYEFREWNESTFNINSQIFVKESYEIGNYAFVSDYVRVYSLYNYGGIYLDTDTEVLKSLDSFLFENSFWGFEEKNYIATSIIGAEPKNNIIKEFLDYYKRFSLYDEKGNIKKFTNVLVVTDILKKKGILLDGTYQKIEGEVTVYPQEYFSPYDYINCYMKQSDYTVAIHHFHKSWLPFSQRMKSNLKRLLARVIGGNRITEIRNLISKN